MEFKDFLEARFDPSLLNLKKRPGGSGKNYLYKSANLTFDKEGNIVPHDYNDHKKGHFEVNPRAKEINLQSISPQSVEFHRLIKALRSYYPDIDEWDVRYFMMAGHMQTGRKSWNRTVGYWMKQGSIDIENKLPQFFYHGTSTNLWYEAIKNKGLMPRTMSGSSGTYGAQNISSLSQDNIVYISTHPDAATRSAAEQAANKHGGRPLIIKINSSGLSKDKLVPDEDSGDNTAQASVRRMSTLAYTGRIPPSILSPFLIGSEQSDGSRRHTKWEKFKDVPMEEHPLTKRLKSGDIPSRGYPEYYALKDAGVIDTERGHHDSGHSWEKDVIKKPLTDEEVRKLLKDSYWTQNVRAITSDLNDGYNGVIYSLKNRIVPENLPPELQETLDMLLKSGIVMRDREFLDVRHWMIEPEAIKLAKLMGRMSFKQLADKIKQISKLSS